ncbi:MAG: T9SS type A sorting domain-containing protein [Lewinellaceae bacterium]|nr:T9SS type A sorting domain-containing protein [Lewinellaceae bacterium]
MRTLLLTTLFSVMSLLSFTQASLGVLNPNQNWVVQQGTIEEATITIEPKGIYLDVGLYLTFSARGAGFDAGDSLEVALDFTLPEEAAIYDSWLWIDDVIVRADILDRRTATNIYEDIVNRRQDPSILYKLGAGQYQLRVYPMAYPEERKVKVSYLLPAQWTTEQILADLPMEAITTSAIPLEFLSLRVWAGAEWGQPRIPELPDAQFYLGSHPDLGSFYEYILSPEEIIPGLTLALDAPLQDGIYVNHNDNLKAFQLVALPDQLVALPEAPPRRLLIYVDYKPYNASGFTKEDLLAGLHRELRAGLSEQDQFQLWATGNGQPVLLSGDWAPGLPEAVDAVFENISLSSFMDGGRLNNALFHALDQVEAQGEETSVLLISNSQDEGDPWYAGELADQLNRHAGFGLADFYAINYQNRNIEQWWDWWGAPSEWRGNDFLYTELARLSGGTYRRSGQFRYKIRKALESADKLRGSIEVYSTLENGICYNRFLLGGSSVNVPLRRPVYQVGRYQGFFPFRLEYLSVAEGMPFFATRTVDPQQIYTIDTLAEEAWAANYLLSLENSNQSDATAQEIVESSIRYRVLSIHTAFLCLEPNLGGDPCISCIDGSNGEIVFPVSTEELAAEDPLIRLRAFPNPFAEWVQARIELLPGATRAEYRFAIYDALGRLVEFLPSQTLSPGQETTVFWDGADMPDGIYFLVVEGPYGKARLKLVKAGG